VTLEERVTRLEQRIEQLDRIERRLEGVEQAVIGLRSDFNTYRTENGAVLGRILATLQNMQPFRWPWESAR
jgi:hypothetical protein